MAPRLRSMPRDYILFSAEVTPLPVMLAEGAERRRLAMCPLLCRDPRLRDAWSVLPVAVSTRNPPAVDAGAVESFLVTERHETKRRLL